MSSITIGQVKKKIATFKKRVPNAPITSTSNLEMMKMTSILAALIDANNERFNDIIQEIQKLLKPHIPYFPQHREYAYKEWEKNLQIADANFAEVKKHILASEKVL